MALSWNEIKDRALRFSREWEGETRERAEKDTFWNEFLNIFGISRRMVATFEKHVQLLGKSTGFIDLFWPGMLLAEHKSAGKNLDAAFKQAIDYFHGIEDKDYPKFIIVSDFSRLRVYDLDEKTDIEFPLSELHEKISIFSEIAGYKKQEFKEEDPVNIKAAEMMGKLHDLLKESGYEGHELEVFLVRLLFCLFSDDTGIFQRDSFRNLIETKTAEDGSNLGSFIETFFEVLNTPMEKRNKLLDEQIAAFPYINGKLFEERLHTAYFNSEMRTMLLKVSELNWGLISPAIFGSMFQSIMNPEERRNLGAHYTSEKNILKLIKPLFLDELWFEFEKTKGNIKKLEIFHKKLSELKFLDPACGSGNFLIITYREIRILELEVIKILLKNERLLDIEHFLLCDVDQFYGIEYEEFPAKIAEVALWLMDHQMNVKVSEAFGLYFARLPLRKSAKIIHGNALRLSWEDIVEKDHLNYILGNPPFIGSKWMNENQREDIKLVAPRIEQNGLLDYVAGWYLKTAEYIQNTSITVALVSTNSISQGEQVVLLWPILIEQYNIQIFFAHQTFQWSNEAKGVAKVYCVIIGFSSQNIEKKKIYSYETLRGEPHEVVVKNIHPYLIDSEPFFIEKRKNTISDVPPFIIGSKPLDGGWLCLSEDEYKELSISEPQANTFIRPLIGSKEFLYKLKRYCLWLVDASPKQLREMPIVKKRIENVKNDRLNGGQSKRACANRPHLFGDNRQPTEDYLVIPKLSSVNREYIPIGYFDANTIVTDLVSVVPGASLSTPG